MGETTGETFDLGRGGGSGSPTAEPVPPGQRWTIPIEIVALDLRAEHVPGLGEVWAMLRPSHPSAGHLSVEAFETEPTVLMGLAGAMGMGGDTEPDEWVLVGNSSLALHIDFVMAGEDQLLFSTQPMPVGADFGPSAGLGLYDALRMAVPIFAVPGAPPVGLVSPLMPDDLWGQWFMEGGVEGTMPQDKGLYCASAGIHVLNESQYVLMRNNAVFVEGGQDLALHDLAHVVIVAADSTTGWDSDFNLLSTRYGAIGKWAGGSQWTLTDWQNASRDDHRSIDSDPDLVWVDPDGDDDRLGFAGVGPSDGRDDNLHLRSRFGHVLTGALAPVEQIAASQPGLPVMQAVTWGADLNELSPAVDWGDPRYDYHQEPAENGQIANLGAYGNTDQASLSEPYYIHLVYPLGREELVGGRTYLIQWRSQLPAMPGVHLEIELRRGDKDGALQLLIDNSVPDSATSYLWTVPLAGISRSDDYVIVVRWPGDPADPNDDLVGQPRRQLTVDADGVAPDDTIPPTVREVTPRVVHHGRSTNDDTLDQLILEFSEPLDAAAAGNPASYELIEAGADGLFDTADDVVTTVTPNYTAGPTDGDPSRVVLDLGGPLQPGHYRLTIRSSAISDLAGLALDGHDNGTAGGDYVRHFAIDRAAPTVQITSVWPDLRNAGVPSVSIVFREPVQGFGMADLRLTRNGGSNLLTGAQTLASDDLITWTLGGLDGITSAEGVYALELIAGDSGIADRAGNLLTGGAVDGWVTDTTRPTVQIAPVTPDPRNVAVDEIIFVFSEPVADFTRTGLTLRRNGGADLLTAANSISSPDGITWTLTGLAALTSTEGIYALELASDNSQVTDLAGNALSGDALKVWETDLTEPVAQIVPVIPGPRNTPVDVIRIQFNEPVTGLTLGDLQLTLNDGANLLTGAETLTTQDSMSWQLNGLTSVTGEEGRYRFTLVAAGSAIMDRAGNPLAAEATATWTVDLTPPDAQIVPVVPDPRTEPIESLTIVFSEPVFGFDPADLVLTRNGEGNLLTGDQPLSTADGITWTLQNLTSLTSAGGDYALRLVAGGSGIVDVAGNPLGGDAMATWRQDLQPPRVERIERIVHPLSGQVTAVEVVFSEPVAGLSLADFRLFHENLLIDVSATASLWSNDQIIWTLDDLSPLTHAAGEYGLELRAFASGIRDLAGNDLPGGSTAAWQMGNVWHNHNNPFDVSAQGGVSALDVLLIINYINSHPNDPSLPEPLPLPPPYYDVNNDGFVTPQDVLLVINYINSQLSGTPEGETSSPALTAQAHQPPRVQEPPASRPVGRASREPELSERRDDKLPDWRWPLTEPGRWDSRDGRFQAKDGVEWESWDSESLNDLDAAFAQWAALPGSLGIGY